MPIDERTGAMWSALHKQHALSDGTFSLSVRFKGDAEGRAAALLVLTAEGPRIQLSETAFNLTRQLDARQIEAAFEDAREGSSWRKAFDEFIAAPRPLSLNEACRLSFGPIFRGHRSTHNYNAYEELVADSGAAAAWFGAKDAQPGRWVSLGALRESWLQQSGMSDASAVDAAAPNRPGISSSRKRTALSALTADSLRSLARTVEAQPDNWRERDSLVHALSDGRRVGFDGLLANLDRDQLKAMCVALGLSSVGQEKRILVDRILRDEADTALAQGAPRIGNRKVPAQATISNPDKKALATLKADRLRQLARELDIDVDDLRDREKLINALADGRRVDFGIVLQQFSRDELKIACEQLALSDVGRDKHVLLDRILSLVNRAEEGDEDEDGEDSVDGGGAAEGSGASALSLLVKLAGSGVAVLAADRGWPARATITASRGRIPVDIYIRSVGRTGRKRPMERRFQNPAEKALRPIRTPREGYALLLGLWSEQGEERAVVVAMDAYRRFDQDTRVSMFMPLALLEEAADTGWAEHRSNSGESVYAFRPALLSHYLDRLARELSESVAPQAATEPARVRVSPPAQRVEPTPDAKGLVHIRPKVGMYAAFARLNYKPWFAIAEFVDNAIQSHLSGPLKQDGEPLLIDIRIDEDEIVVTDRACGIAERDFPRAFSPSQPPPDAGGLSEFGLGMKAAACWFARQWSVRTSAYGDPVERSISFDIPRITLEGIESLPVETRPSGERDHYTVITLSNLRVRPRGRTLAKVKDHLSGIYRVLMRNGAVRIRLSAGSASEELTYHAPSILTAPHFREPDGPEREWKREFDIKLDGGRRVWGWAGLLASGSVSRAGFSVFRRDRLIQGSGDETYRPSELFGSANKYTYQRLVGEMFVEGFDVSHTKDGIQWDGLEEIIIDKLRSELSRYDLPILQQAEGYRARRKAQDLESGFGLSAVASTGAVLSGTSTADALTEQVSTKAPEETSTPPLSPPEKTLTKRTFTINVARGRLPWCVTIELIADRPADWFVYGSETKLEERNIHVLVNLAHPFSEQFINDSEAALGPLLRVVCGLALAEETARESGVRQAGEIRRRLNHLLREALGNMGRETDAAVGSQ